jgi:hypothetical protein
MLGGGSRAKKRALGYELEGAGYASLNGTGDGVRHIRYTGMGS